VIGLVREGIDRVPLVKDENGKETEWEDAPN